MEVEFSDDDLARLDREKDFVPSGVAQEAVRGFRKVLQFIRAAADERDFRSMRSLNFEKLKGARAHQHSLRLNKQWRLIVEVVPGNSGNVIRVVAVEDYH